MGYFSNVQGNAIKVRAHTQDLTFNTDAKNMFGKPALLEVVGSKLRLTPSGSTDNVQAPIFEIEITSIKSIQFFRRLCTITTDDDKTYEIYGGDVFMGATTGQIRRWLKNVAKVNIPVKTYRGWVIGIIAIICTIVYFWLQMRS